MQQAVQALRTVDLIAPPGMVFQYSNLNYVIAGLIVQAASGQSYEAYVGFPDFFGGLKVED